MLIGVSTENLTSNTTPLSKDIAEIHQFNVRGIEIVPKTYEDLWEGSVLKASLGKFEYIGVLLPPPPVTENPTSVNETSNYYQDAIRFSAEIGAHLVMVRSDFPGCGSPGDVIKFLQPINEYAMKKGLKMALLNWFTPESQCGTYDQVSEIVNAINCKLAIDLGHAYRAMDSKSVKIIGEQKSRIVAIRASDATTAFGELPLGTGHVDFPVIMPLLEESGFSGPFFVTHKRDPRPESIRTSISYLEYFEL